MRPAVLLLPCILAACGDPGGDYPALVPLETLLDPAIPAHAAAAAASPAGVAAEVTAAGAAARGRAAAAQVQGDADLQARAAALRERAEVLRNTDPGV